MWVGCNANANFSNIHSKRQQVTENDSYCFPDESAGNALRWLRKSYSGTGSKEREGIRMSGVAFDGCFLELFILAVIFKKSSETQTTMSIKA